MNLQKAKEKVFSKPTANRKTKLPSGYFLSASEMVELSNIAQTGDDGIFEVIALAFSAGVIAGNHATIKHNIGLL